MTAITAIQGEPDPTGSDCVSCGQCCFHGPNTVHLLEPDEARMGEPLLTTWTFLDSRPPRWRFLKNTGERCAALDTTTPGQFPCALYEVRPVDCRIVEPGSPACLEARRLGHLGKSVLFLRVQSSP
ncbi:MAG: YkgJ family cysteine cluster protein [Myxococcales bacterium]